MNGFYWLIYKYKNEPDIIRAVKLKIDELAIDWAKAQKRAIVPIDVVYTMHEELTKEDVAEVKDSKERGIGLGFWVPEVYNNLTLEDQLKVNRYLGWESPWDEI